MASEDLNAPLPASVHPMANPGFGKRSAPDQEPRRPGEFGHLPARAAYVAGFLDRLVEGSAMDAKTLAKAIPLYGQQAVRTALNELSAAGHLRRVRRRAETADGTTRWVFHTFWSRTARDDAWWSRVIDGDVPSPSLSPPPPPPPPQRQADAETRQHARPAPQDPKPQDPTPQPSAAYAALARVGRAEPRMALSAADCAALEELAAEWLARGASAGQLVQALTAGLPEPVHSPRALAHRRLTSKMPPELPAAGASRTLLECTDCGVPGSPAALPGGLCRACRTAPDPAAGRPASPAARARLDAADVRERTDRLRGTLAGTGRSARGV
ncbi:hypothetical protein ACX6XY_25880 [Streptomyces sp. O3]